MKESNWKAVIDAAMQPAEDYLASLPSRRVYHPAEPGEIKDLLDGPLPEKGTPPEEVVASLGRDLEPFITSHASMQPCGLWGARA